MSFFQKILIVVLLPISTFGIYELNQYRHVTKAFEESIVSELRKSSSETKGFLEETLENSRKIGHAIRVSEDLANDLLFAETDKLFLTTQPFMGLDVDYIALINNDHMVISRGHDELFFGDIFSNTDLLRNVQQQAQVSGIFLLDGDLYLATAMPVLLYDEQPVGTLVIGYSLLNRVLPEIEKYFSLGVSAILDESLIYSSQPVYLDHYDSILVSFSSSELSNLTLTMHQDNSEKRKQLQATQYHSILLLMFVLTLTTLYLFFLIKKLVLPIKLLAEDMQRYKNGKREMVTIPITSGEVGKIINIYESMKRENISLLEELERKVHNRTRELNKKNDQLRLLSTTDQLTKIYNRTKLDRVLEIEFLRANNGEHPFGLILVDIDHFKNINDSYGHLIGDEFLVQFAQLLNSCASKKDFIGRWGGEEFLIVCTDSEADEVYQLAEKIRCSVEQFEFSKVKYRTASFGISLYKVGTNIEALLKQADDALYQAKNNGRNRVEPSRSAEIERPVR